MRLFSTFFPTMLYLCILRLDLLYSLFSFPFPLFYWKFSCAAPLVERISCPFPTFYRLLLFAWPPNSSKLLWVFSKDCNPPFLLSFSKVHPVGKAIELLELPWMEIITNTELQLLLVFKWKFFSNDASVQPILYGCQNFNQAHPLVSNRVVGTFLALNSWKHKIKVTSNLYGLSFSQMLLVGSNPIVVRNYDINQW